MTCRGVSLLRYSEFSLNHGGTFCWHPCPKHISHPIWKKSTMHWVEKSLVFQCMNSVSAVPSKIACRFYPEFLVCSCKRAETDCPYAMGPTWVWWEEWALVDQEMEVDGSKLLIWHSVVTRLSFGLSWLSSWQWKEWHGCKSLDGGGCSTLNTY